jgi:hypothetical protein
MPAAPSSAIIHPDRGGGWRSEAVGEPAERGGGVDAFSGEERVEFGDHGRAGAGEEPFAELQQLGG